MQDNYLESLQLIKAATDLKGDTAKALFCYRNEPLSIFGDKTAQTLISEGRAEDVIRFLAFLEAGTAG